MRVSTKDLISPIGVRIKFEKAPVVKIHIAVKRPDTDSPYCADAVITMPEEREKWLEAANAAFKRIQTEIGSLLQINYANAMRFFTLDQLEDLEERNPTFSLHIYNAPNVPKEKCSVKYTEFSERDFARMYYRRNKGVQK